MMSLTKSPMEMSPTSLSLSMIGRWRKRFSVISAMQTSLVCSGRTNRTGLDMMSRTGVSFDDRAMSTILRA